MKALILGNMANDGYVLCKQLQKMGVDVTLGLNTNDFGMCYPEWEDADLEPMNPYGLKRQDIKKTIDYDWIQNFDLDMNLRTRELVKRVLQVNKIKRFADKFDIIEAHAPYSIATYFSKTPYIVCDEGWIRTLTEEKLDRTLRGKLVDNIARASYKKGKHIIIKNPDTRMMFDNDWIKQVPNSFIPFGIEHDRYKPMKTDFEKKPDEIILFSPARQDWHVKGNDKMIRAFAKFTKSFHSKLILVEWGTMCMASRELIHELGITDKVEWIQPVPKHILIKYYNFADIVLDQFLCGCWGTTTPEAMSCGTPVLLSFGESHIEYAFGEQPPIFPVYSEDEIYNGMIKLAKDTDYRLKLGKDSREWIKKTHDPKTIAQQHLDLWKKTIE